MTNNLDGIHFDRLNKLTKTVSPLNVIFLLPVPTLRVFDVK